MKNKIPGRRPRVFGAISLVAAGWLLTIPAPLTAAEPSVCATCWDGPEMFQHVKPKDVGGEVSAVTIKCEAGSIARTFGKSAWLVTECDDGSLMFSTGTDNRAPQFFSTRLGGIGNPFVEERPRDRGARAAYDEVQSLTTEQIEALVRDIRAITRDRAGST
jgi:hypothetical protein